MEEKPLELFCNADKIAREKIRPKIWKILNISDARGSKLSRAVTFGGNNLKKGRGSCPINATYSYSLK